MKPADHTIGRLAFVSGGAMVTCLGHAVPELAAAAAEQAQRIAYFYNHHFTSEPQERLADRVLEVMAPEMARQVSPPFLWRLSFSGTLAVVSGLPRPV